MIKVSCRFFIANKLKQNLFLKKRLEAKEA